MKIKLLAIVLIPFIFVGCAYKTEVKPHSMAAISVQKHPYSIAIDGSKLKDKYVNQNFDMANLTVVYGNAFLEDLKNQIEPNFKQVNIVHPPYKPTDYDMVFDIDENMVFKCGGSSCNYETTTRLKATNSSGEELFIKEIPNRFRYSTPGFAWVLVIVTGLTQYLASPITMPVVAILNGNRLTDDIAKANTDSIKSLSAEIIEQNSFSSEKVSIFQASSGIHQKKH